MSRTYKDSPNAKQSRPRQRRQRDISVRAVRRDPPDVRKLSRALITLTAEAEATVEQVATPQRAEQPPADQEQHD